MRIPKIAIIDSGIAPQQIDSVCKIDVVGEIEGIFDNINHGSAILNIIKNYSKKIQIQCIKITDDIEISEENLCQALRMLLNDSDVDIVNISMGIVISERGQEIADLCLQLRKKGVIIVSAFDNDGAMSYPAAFPWVIGVDISPRCKLVRQYEYVEDDVINLRAFSGVIHTKVGNDVLSVSGTSFACAIITAKIADLIYSNITNYDEIMGKLKMDATYITPKQEYVALPKIPLINKAIVFPFNKEMNALLANQDLLKFEVTSVFDPIQLGNVGKRISDILMGPLKKDFIIDNILNLDWSSEFDTVILGHTREISETLNFDFKNYVIEKCKKYHKFLYSFDNFNADYNLSYFVPRVLEQNIPRNRYGKLYQVPCPVLGIFGTSSKQGKFSLQLKLRRQFLKAQYSLAQIGTEPSSLLFGMDAVYPMGYDGVVPQNSRDAITVLNDMLNKCVDYNTDIVLVGAQSGSGVYSCQNISLFPIESFNLLLATQPDAIILCVNIYDDDEYISRTIMTLENMIATYVIALVVSPIAYTYINTGLSRKTNQIEKEKLEAFKMHLAETFKRKTFILNFEEDAEDIFNCCIETLTQGVASFDL